MEDIETTYIPDNGKIYTSIDGTKFKIGKQDIHFLSQLQNLPALHRIELMLLTEDEINYAVNQHKMILASKVIDLFKKKWYWKETGDLAEFDAEICPCLKLKDLGKKLLKNHSRYPIQEYLDVIDFFEKDTSEVYLKPDKELI